MGTINCGYCLPENAYCLVLMMIIWLKEVKCLATTPGDTSPPDRFKENATYMGQFLLGISESIPGSCYISCDKKKQKNQQALDVSFCSFGEYLSTLHIRNRQSVLYTTNPKVASFERWGRCCPIQCRRSL